MDGTLPVTKPTFDISKRTIAPKFGQKLLTVFEIQPYVELTRVVPENSFKAESEPPNERHRWLRRILHRSTANRNVQRAWTLPSKMVIVLVIG
jgi:hypothetical protein